MLKQLHANRGSTLGTQQFEVDVAGNNKWGSFSLVLVGANDTVNSLLQTKHITAMYICQCLLLQSHLHCNELVTNSETWNIPVYTSVNLLVFLSY
jgi:hypothetical protein